MACRNTVILTQLYWNLSLCIDCSISLLWKLLNQENRRKAPLLTKIWVCGVRFQSTTTRVRQFAANLLDPIVWGPPTRPVRQEIKTNISTSKQLVQYFIKWEDCLLPATCVSVPTCTCSSFKCRFVVIIFLFPSDNHDAKQSDSWSSRLWSGFTAAPSWVAKRVAVSDVC